MSDAQYQVLWARVCKALRDKGAFPPDEATESEIAAHAREVLGSDLVREFVNGYYNPRRYGAQQSQFSDTQAEGLVQQLERLDRAPPRGEKNAGYTAPPAERIADGAVPPRPRVGLSFGAEEAGSDRIARLLSQLGGETDERSIPAAPAAEQAKIASGDEPASSSYAPALERPNRQDGSETSGVSAGNAMGEVVASPGHKIPEKMSPAPKAAEPAPSDAALLERLAEGYYLQRDYRAAAEVYERLTALDPGSARHWERLAHVLENHSHNGEGAIKAFREAVKRDPEVVSGWRKAAAEHDEKREAAQAVHLMERIIQVSSAPNSDYAYLGRLYQGQGEHNKALEAFNRSLEIEAKQPSVWLSLAKSLRAMGKWQEAADYFDRCLAADSTLAEARALREECRARIAPPKEKQTPKAAATWTTIAPTAPAGAPSATSERTRLINFIYLMHLLAPFTAFLSSFVAMAITVTITKLRDGDIRGFDQYHEAFWLTIVTPVFSFAIWAFAVAFAAELHFPFDALLGILFSYLFRRGATPIFAARSAWIDSHHSWLLRTFCFLTILVSIGFAVIGWGEDKEFIGSYAYGGRMVWVWGLVSSWYLYRVLRGWILLWARKPAPPFFLRRNQ